MPNYSSHREGVKVTLPETCKHKRVFETHAEAKQIRRLRHAEVKLFIYKCDICFRYHFTSTNYK